MKFDCFIDCKGYSALSISNFLCCRPSRSVESTNQSTAILEIIKSDCEDALAFVLYDMPVGRKPENKDNFLYSFHLRSFLKMRLEATGDKRKNNCLTDDINKWQLTDDSYFENLYFSGDEVNRWLTVNLEQYKFCFPLLQGISLKETRVSEIAELLPDKMIIARQTEIVRQARDEYEATKLMTATEAESVARSNLPTPVQRTAAQDAAILSTLAALNINPLLIPKNKAGKAGTKKRVRTALEGNLLFVGSTVFDKAWERLSARGDIVICS